MMNLSDLTIIIPTINRPSMLRRTLAYYVRSDISSKIILADSSNEESKNLNNDIMRDFSNKLEIEYFHVHQDTSVMKKISIATDMVDTEYVLTIGDDDYLLKSSLLSVMNELDKDRSIVAGYGHRVGIRAMSKKTVGLGWIDVFPFYDMSIENDLPLDRIRHLPVPSWQQYPYAICRSDVLKSANNIVSSCQAAQYVEFFQLAAILSYGKWKKFDCLFAVCNTDSPYYTLRSKKVYPIYWGYDSKGNIPTQISLPIWSQYIATLTDRVAELLTDNQLDRKDITIKLTRIYWAINNRYLEQHGLLSKFLFHDDQLIAKKLNMFLTKFNTYIYIFLLSDRNGGFNAWRTLFYGVLREVMTGRIFKCRFNESYNSNFLQLFAHIKRTGSLDYELINLLKVSSKHYSEFSMIFESWVDNPCPKIHHD